MANLKSAGVPTRNTVGAMGDIYTDTTTGKKYECIFAYRDNTDSEFDCQWKELVDDTKTVVEEETETAETSEKIESKLEIKSESEPLTEQKDSKRRTNYMAAYNKKNNR